MTKKQIHVNKNLVYSHARAGTWGPVITIKEGKKNTYCHAVEIMGPSKILSNEDGSPLLSCGARVIIETEAEVKILY